MRTKLEVGLAVVGPLRSAAAGRLIDPHLCKQQLPVRGSWLVGCDGDAPSHEANIGAQEPRLRLSPAKAAAPVGPLAALWGCCMPSSLAAATPTRLFLSSVKQPLILPTALHPNIASALHVGEPLLLSGATRTRTRCRDTAALTRLLLCAAAALLAPKPCRTMAQGSG